ncbi:hypothetical protein [Microbispora catharanthi]|uniref:Uncharacterized protein n=1 Tax=Microbispora catharanthi TaxID=1712871 RepID=A0A5N6BHB6_9ACTN|nr:hypothetical protein [Microbispora catharanthi]KAB8180451.1 hypothetical protein FH610_033235 [Microbispora catharanthi]
MQSDERWMIETPVKNWNRVAYQFKHLKKSEKRVRAHEYPRLTMWINDPNSKAAAADRLLESEVTSAAFRQAYRHRLGRDETARDAFDQARPRHAAREEAMGAGVCLLGMFVTITVLDATNLPQAVAATAGGPWT